MIRRSKYNNKRTNGHMSKKEDIRAIELYMMMKQGKIRELKEQVKFELQPSFKIGNKTIRAINYIADFTYYDEKGNFIVEDCKGYKTEIYKIKKKSFEYKYKIQILET